MIPTILVVDDESDLAATCQRLLTRGGWSVVTAGTCAAAITALVAQPRPALAIVDHRLPDGDGLDVLRAARGAGTPVIMVTGYGSSETRRHALQEGAAGFLPKPFSARDLLALVHTIAGDPAARKAGLPRAPAPDPRYPPGP
jgi:DNA-binding response OmpR family regulator